MNNRDELTHYGILRRSGRYPWGSGSTQRARNRSFLDTIEDLRRQGMSETEIAKAFSTEEHPFTTTMLRAAKSIALAQQKQDQINMAQRLKDKGYSNTAIGVRMGINESSVRALLAPGRQDKLDILNATTDMLKRQVAEKRYLDVGAGTNLSLPLSDNPSATIGISSTKFNVALARMKEEGYTLHTIKVPQLGTGEYTTLKVLADKGVSTREIYQNQGKIKSLSGEFSEDGGRSYLGLRPPLSISSKRVGVRYADEGGSEADGIIYIRPGVKDLSMGSSRYAQVRIAVDNTHYLKGMAVYKDDLPEGVDLLFNTNKKSTGNKLDAMKRLKDDPDNPFGAVVRQQIKGDRVTSALNVVNQEGDWENWSRNLSSQFLSKQTPELAKTQLNMTYERRRNELDRISALTNPSVRKRLLKTYADEADSSAVHLKAAALPRQGSHVIVPINSLKPNEVYAPSGMYRHGEKVVLIRYPHGGRFEIPELVVNNQHAPAKKLLGDAKDAIGINSKVAERLSGADFDGDTVLVIPNNRGLVKTAPALTGLKDFDPRSSYPPHDGMRTIDGGVYKEGKVDYGGRSPRGSTKQAEMGKVTNLIADMTIRGANNDEIARAVRHSMVVIDAEKHSLDYKASERDNGIAQLKAKYQGIPSGAKNPERAGATTLITRASSEIRVPDRKPRSASKGGPIDKATGKRVYEQTGRTYVDRRGNTVLKTQVSKRLAETDDAFTLSSGTPIETIYAEHSNRLKALANAARKVEVNTKTTPYSPSAKAVYNTQVQSLNAKLNVALKNAPLERQAQVIANAILRAKRDANPNMDSDDLKKIKNQALAEARTRTGAKKQQIIITDEEWNAIQAGAISQSKLDRILENADIDRVRELATPRATILMTPIKRARAEAMLNSGYTQIEIADALGVSLSTIKTAIEE